ncbi:MAG: bifunctional metallophosphatase/5'-nucleotidase, partial [Archangium sp.]|nr:bifunctional metallophosphatase/5'-nucleotidase [Archangium sp.]
MHRHLTIVSLFMVACATTPQPSPPSRTAGLIRITVVGTNDVHGWVMAQSEKFPQGEIRFGGVAAFAAYLKVLREENPDGLVLLDGGDLFQGTLMSNITEGSVVIDAYNRLGYDAAAIGNHEFDYGPVGPVSAVQTGMDAFGALKMRIAQANFPLLSTNIYDAATGVRPPWLPGDGTVLIERQGLKIGIIGLTTPQTPTTTLPINVASLKFKSLGYEAITAANRLRAKGADLVFAVVHAGGKCSDCSHHNDLSSCDTDSGEIFELMRDVPEGTLDAIVAGHTHGQMAHMVKGTPIIESWAHGRYFGRIELFIDPTTKRVVPGKTELQTAIEICETVDEATGSCEVKKLQARAPEVHPVQARFKGRLIEPDPDMLAELEPTERRVSELQHRELGLRVPQTLGRNYENESALGNFLTDSIRAMYRADVALINPGGIRADLRQGKLTYGDVYEVFPFDNSVATLELTGAQLQLLLNAAYGSRKGVFQVSGLAVTLSRCPSPSRLQTVTLPNGKPIDSAGRYRVVMPDFLARGGDGLAPVLATIDPERVDLGVNRGSNL